MLILLKSVETNYIFIFSSTSTDENFFIRQISEAKFLVYVSYFPRKLKPGTNYSRITS